MRWITSPKITTIHGFSTRNGGVSLKPFDSLNLGGSEDDPACIDTNRKIALGDLGIQMEQVAYLNQVHSSIVCNARPGKQNGDALVTNEKNLALAVGAADCYPVLFYDSKNRVIGAAHCGWRGTLDRIVRNTVQEMLRLGAELDCIKVAIGQGISAENYEVGEEIIGQFRNNGFPDTCWKDRQLNLLAANQFVAGECGVRSENIWSMNRCTTEPDFFSYRRDYGKTGRMWAVIMI